MTFDPDELSIIAVSGPLWLKMLTDRERKVLDKLHGQFRAGATKDAVRSVAEFCLVRDQLNEIKQALQKAQEKEK